jgi:hypothetical protein
MKHESARIAIPVFSLFALCLARVKERLPCCRLQLALHACHACCITFADKLIAIALTANQAL